MNFPERLVIDLKKWPRKANKLVNILQKISESSFCLEYMDVGNDIKYCINEVPNFYPKLSQLVRGIAVQQGNDILSNRFNSFNSYKFIELIFSEDLKTITSIRLLGKVKRKNKEDKIIRYVEFNVNNIFDPNIIYLIYRSDEIVSRFSNNVLENLTSFMSQNLNFGIDFLQPDINKNSFTKFLDTYLLPAATLNKKDVRPIECLLDDIKSQVDTLMSAASLNVSLAFGEEIKINELFNAQSIDWTNSKILEVSLQEKQIYNKPENSIQIYNQRRGNYDPNSLLNKFLSEGDRINKKLKNQNDVIGCLTTVSNEFYNKIDVCYLIKKFLSSCAGDLIEKWLREQASVTAFFNAIDNWKNPVIEQFYQYIWTDQFLWGALRKVEILLQDYVCVDSLSDTYRYEKVSDVLNKLSSKFPQHADSIKSIFEQNFSRDLMIDLIKGLIPDLAGLLDAACNWKWPSIRLPKLTFKGLYDDFIIDIQTLIFNALCGLLSKLSQALLDFILTNLCSLPEFMVDLFMNFPNNLFNLPDYLIDLYTGVQKSPEERWQQYMAHCFDMMSKANGLNIEFTSITDPRLLDILRSLSSDSAPISMGDANGQGEVCQDVPSADEEEDIPGTQGNQFNLGSTIENIKNYNYCLGRDNFYTTDVSEDTSVQTLRLISEILRLQQERQEQINFIASMDQGELSQRLLRMIKQIQSVLTPRELSMLIMGRYNDTIAEVVRMICKINFPSLSDRLDPIKYFIMIGKVLGGIPTIEAVRG